MLVTVTCCAVIKTMSQVEESLRTVDLGVWKGRMALGSIGVIILFAVGLVIAP